MKRENTLSKREKKKKCPSYLKNEEVSPSSPVLEEG